MKTQSLLFSSLLLFPACQGESYDEGGDGETGGHLVNPNDPCGACDPGYYAVDCGYLWGLGEFPEPFVA